jgi:cell division protein FtsB
LKAKLIIGALLLTGAGYFAIFGGEYNVFELRRVRHEQALEEQRAADMRIAVEAQRARRDSLANDSATIERIAREQYGMIRDGERLYRFADSAQDSLARTRQRVR